MHQLMRWTLLFGFLMILMDPTRAACGIHYLNSAPQVTEVSLL